MSTNTTDTKASRGLTAGDIAGIAHAGVRILGVVIDAATEIRTVLDDVVTAIGEDHTPADIEADIEEEVWVESAHPAADALTLVIRVPVDAKGMPVMLGETFASTKTFAGTKTARLLVSPATVKNTHERNARIRRLLARLFGRQPYECKSGVNTNTPSGHLGGYFDFNDSSLTGHGMWEARP